MILLTKQGSEYQFLYPLSVSQKADIPKISDFYASFFHDSKCQRYQNPKSPVSHSPPRIQSEVVLNLPASTGAMNHTEPGQATDIRERSPVDMVNICKYHLIIWGVSMGFIHVRWCRISCINSIKHDRQKSKVIQECQS